MTGFNMGSFDFSERIGSFAVKDGVTYRETAYWKESALFDLHDTKQKNELIRVAKDQLSERFTAFVNCEYQGVRYSVWKIEEGYIYFFPFTNQKKTYCRPLAELDAVWIQRNYGNARVERELFYEPLQNKGLPWDRSFYPEEMYNGNLMLSYLEDVLDLSGTKKFLAGLYQGRIQFGKPELGALITDEYISSIKIDGKEFDFTEDLAYELITISPKQADGNVYIREICTYFNRQRARWLNE